MLDEVRDFRWNTRNTKLASALLVLGFELSDQPFTTVVSAENASKGYVTTIWFRPYKKGPDLRNGKPNPMLFCQGIERMWSSGLDPKHPEIFWMRKALEARDWILKDFRHRDFRSVQISNLWEKLDDIKLAFALSSNSHPPLAFRDHKFYFHPSAKPLIDEYKASEGSGRMQWSKAVILQQDILMQAINGPKNCKQVQIRNEGLDRTLIMATAVPEELKREFLRALDKF